MPRIIQKVIEPQSVADRLLPAAAALFRRKGYAGASIRDLAADLGISSASLYHYIDTKEDLLQAVCVASIKRLHSRVEQAVTAEPNPLQRVRALVNVFVTTILDEDLDMHASALLEGRWLSPAKQAVVSERLRRWQALFDRVIAEAQDSGQLRRDVSTHDLSRALRNLVCWSITWYPRVGEPTSAELGALFERLFLEGAQAPVPVAV